MALVIQCYDPITGTPITVTPSTVGDGAGASFQNPSFGAQRINLSMPDVHRTIAEGRAAGIKPFNLYNSGFPNDRLAPM